MIRRSAEALSVNSGNVLELQACAAFRLMRNHFRRMASDL
jgi:hypothetical protein